MNNKDKIESNNDDVNKDGRCGPQSEERRDKMSEIITEWHANNEHPMTGKHHSDEARKKISEGNKGKKMPPESVKAGAEKHKIKSEKEQSIIKLYVEGKEIKEIEKALDANAPLKIFQYLRICCRVKTIIFTRKYL